MVRQRAKVRASSAGSSPDPAFSVDGTNRTHVSYFSVVGVYVVSLVFASLALPSSIAAAASAHLPPDPSQLSSKDRPQHPFLNSLTQHPVVTLLSLCIGAAILQGWLAGWIRHWWINATLSSSSASNDELKAKKTALNDSKVSSILSATATTAFASLLLYVIAILFGAPILEHTFKTYLLALLLAILTTFTPAYIIGSPSLKDSPIQMTWVRLFADFRIQSLWERAVVFPFIGSFLGAWAGVIPIALDWDRPWQAWPLTPAYGSILGNALATIAAAIVSTTIIYNQQPPSVASKAFNNKK